MTSFAKILTGAAGLAMVAGAAAPAAAQGVPTAATTRAITAVAGHRRSNQFGPRRRALRRLRPGQRPGRRRPVRPGGRSSRQPRLPLEPLRQLSAVGLQRSRATPTRVTATTARPAPASSGSPTSSAVERPQGVRRDRLRHGLSRRLRNQGYIPRYANQGYDPRYPNQGYPNQAYGNGLRLCRAVADLRFTCRVDFRGYVTRRRHQAQRGPAPRLLRPSLQGAEYARPATVARIFLAVSRPRCRSAARPRGCRASNKARSPDASTGSAWTKIT